MRILVTGVNGQLGYDVIKELERRGISCKGVDLADFDLTDREAAHRYVKKYRPEAVVHCAAYTAVDKSEDEQELCSRVNVDGTRHIAEVCRELDAKLLYVSTDYVFAGQGDGFYHPEDPTCPMGVYGQTKLEGEQAVQHLLEQYFIVRISWVFGKNGNNFIKTMLRLGAERESVSVVADQFGSPTYTADLAPLLCDIIATEKYGIYHATNEGVCSWAELAAETMRLAGLACRVEPIPTSAYPTRAVRPGNSRLDKTCLDAAGFSRLPSWQSALARYLDEIKSNDK